MSTPYCYFIFGAAITEAHDIDDTEQEIVQSVAESALCGQIWQKKCGIFEVYDALSKSSIVVGKLIELFDYGYNNFNPASIVPTQKDIQEVENFFENELTVEQKTVFTKPSLFILTGLS